MKLVKICEEPMIKTKKKGIISSKLLEVVLSILKNNGYFNNFWEQNILNIGLDI